MIGREIAELPWMTEKIRRSRDFDQTPSLPTINVWNYTREASYDINHKVAKNTSPNFLSLAILLNTIDSGSVRWKEKMSNLARFACVEGKVYTCHSRVQTNVFKRHHGCQGFLSIFCWWFWFGREFCWCYRVRKVAISVFGVSNKLNEWGAAEEGQVALRGRCFSKEF